MLGANAQRNADVPKGPTTVPAPMSAPQPASKEAATPKETARPRTDSPTGGTSKTYRTDTGQVEKFSALTWPTAYDRRPDI